MRLGINEEENAIKIECFFDDLASYIRSDLSNYSSYSYPCFSFIFLLLSVDRA